MTDIYEMIPEGTSGNFSVVKEGDMISLMEQDGDVGYTWMSNTHWEKTRHENFKRNVRGDILIAGLGLGYNVVYCEDKDVSSVDVVEISKDVINLVAEHIRYPKLKVINDRILHYLETTKKKYDFIWFDIFPGDPGSFLPEVDILIKAAKPKLKKGGNIEFWRLFKEITL